MMEETEFVDLMYQLWSKTTWAENGYWKYDEDTKYFDGGPGTYNLSVVNEKQEEQPVGSVENRYDAEFITAIHGSFQDLYRRFLTALDDAEKADYDRDERECRIYELEVENQSLTEELAHLEGRLIR